MCAGRTGFTCLAKATQPNAPKNTVPASEFPVIVAAGQRCSPGAMSGESLERAVWAAVTEALQNPQVLIDEYQSRIEDSDAGAGIVYERRQVELALRQVRVQEDRFTQAYANEAMDLKRYKTEMDKLRARTKELNGTSRDLSRRIEKNQGTERTLEHIETFCLRIGEGLGHMSFEERQDLLRLVVDNITIENGTVRIDAIIPSGDGIGQLRTRRGEPVEPLFRNKLGLPALSLTLSHPWERGFYLR